MPQVDIIEQIRAFGDFGTPSVRSDLDGVPVFTNEFWTSAQRQGHPIHEISYRACFKPQLPAFFIERLTRRGETVLDPFGGRGTTAVQAALMGRRAVSNDVSPLSAMLTRPRLAPPSLDSVSRALKTVRWGEARRDNHDKDLLAFYHPDTLDDIETLRDWIKQTDDEAADWIRMVALNRLTGHSPGFFSVRTLPPNQAVSARSQRRLNEKGGLTPPRRDVPGIILKKTASLLRRGAPEPRDDHELLTGDAWNLEHLADGTVDLTVTSPPFLDVVDYAEDNWLRSWFAGVDRRAVRISNHRTEEEWVRMVERVLVEQERVLRPGGHVAFEVGEVKGGKVKLESLVLRAARATRLTPLCVMINAQNFTKTANCWGVDNRRKGTNTNRIVLLRRN